MYPPSLSSRERETTDINHHSIHPGGSLAAHNTSFRVTRQLLSRPKHCTPLLSRSGIVYLIPCDYVNAPKTWLVAKESVMSEASKILSGTAVNITSHGRPYLGSPLGSQSYVEEFIQEKIELWKDEFLQLCTWACTQPHAAFTAYIHG